MKSVARARTFVLFGLLLGATFASGMYANNVTVNMEDRCDKVPASVTARENDAYLCGQLSTDVKGWAFGKFQIYEGGALKSLDKYIKDRVTVTVNPDTLPLLKVKRIVLDPGLNINALGTDGSTGKWYRSGGGSRPGFYFNFGAGRKVKTVTCTVLSGLGETSPPSDYSWGGEENGAGPSFVCVFPPTGTRPPIRLHVFYTGPDQPDPNP